MIQNSILLILEIKNLNRLRKRLNSSTNDYMLVHVSLDISQNCSQQRICFKNDENPLLLV
jgi:hypothetical protein